MNNLLKSIAVAAIAISLSACKSTDIRIPILENLMFDEMPDSFITQEHSFDEGKARLTFFKHGKRAGGIYMDCDIKNNDEFVPYYYENVSSFFFMGNYRGSRTSEYTLYRIDAEDEIKSIRDGYLHSLRFVFKDENYLNKEIKLSDASEQYLEDSCKEYSRKKENEEWNRQRALEVEKENLRIADIEMMDKIIGEFTGISRIYTHDNKVQPVRFFKLVHENGEGRYKNKFIRLEVQTYYVSEVGVNHVILSTNPYGLDSAKNRPNIRLNGFTYDKQWVPQRHQFYAGYVYNSEELVFKDYKKGIFGKDELVFDRFSISKDQLKKINSEFDKRKSK